MFNNNKNNKKVNKSLFSINKKRMMKMKKAMIKNLL